VLPAEGPFGHDRRQPPDRKYSEVV